MKIAVSNIAWENKYISEYLKLLKSLDCSGVEIAPNIIWPEPINSSKEDRQVFKKLVVRSGTVKAIAVFRRPNRTLDNIQLPKKPVILILDGIEKPGNVGALMRTANAVSVDAVIFSSLKCDPLSPYSVRNSLGGIFNTPWFEANRIDVIKFVLESNLKCFLMDLNGADFNFEQNLNEAYAIVLGSEDDGISNEWSRIAAEKVKIPMDGIVDSLNVSVAGAIILYEFRRQRKNFGK